MIQARKVVYGGLGVGVSIAALFAARMILGSPQGAARQLQAEQARDAVGLLRLINNGESRYREGARKYASWDELSNAGIVAGIAAKIAERRREMGIAVPPPDAASNPDSSDLLPGYMLSLYVSPDRSRYLCSLRDESKGACRLSFFTDDSGVIMQAKPIGCK